MSGGEHTHVELIWSERGGGDDRRKRGGGKGETRKEDWKWGRVEGDGKRGRGGG